MENYQPQIFKNPGPRRVPREIHLELELLTGMLDDDAAQLEFQSRACVSDAAQLVADAGVIVREYCDPITWTIDDPDVQA